LGWWYLTYHKPEALKILHGKKGRTYSTYNVKIPPPLACEKLDKWENVKKKLNGYLMNGTER
jgi:hypothetical protein